MRVVVGSCLAVVLLASCSAPALTPVKPEESHTGILAFLKEGRTTREETLLRLGTPDGRFEGERILTYTFKKGPDGWLREGRAWNEPKKRFEYTGRSGFPCNLVLVFGAEGVLARSTMVITQ